jgi:Gluconate 2-dehydrogenase subunit 3
MERRTALKILGIGAVASRLQPLATPASCHEHAELLEQSVSQPTQYRLQFFTAEENELVDQLSELIIPADCHSPGAQAAKVSFFADMMLASGDEQAKQQWRNGLRLIKQEAAKSSLVDGLAKAAANEADPKTELEHFFAALKQMTVNGYYTSSIGVHQDLGYRGNSYLSSFPGCTHPEHSR